MTYGQSAISPAKPMSARREKHDRQAPKHVRQLSARPLFVSAKTLDLDALADIFIPDFRL